MRWLIILSCFGDIALVLSGNFSHFLLSAMSVMFFVDVIIDQLADIEKDWPETQKSAAPPD